MPRKPTSIPGIAREVVPIAPQSECVGMCMDVNCQRCWDDFFANVLAPDLWHLPAVPAQKPLRVTAEIDDGTYTALQDEALSHYATVADVVWVVLREWAAARKARP